MALTECILNVVPLSATLALLFAFPMLAFVKACKYLVSWFTYENVRGKVITGASSGIGEHIAYQYAKKGARLVLVARVEELLRAVADRSITYVDHLVNNAGSVSRFFFADCADTAALHTVLDTDFWGPVNMTYFDLPHATIVGSKAGVLQFFDTLRVEECDSVGINTVMPGFTESEAKRGMLVGEQGDMILDSDRREAHFALQAMAYSETVAKASVNGMLRGYRYVITPFYVSVLLLYRLIAPEVLDILFSYRTLRNPSKPLSKQILDATGAQKYLYARSAQKGD